MEPNFKPIINEKTVISFPTGTFKLSLLLSLLSEHLVLGSFLSDLADSIAQVNKGTIPRTGNIIKNGVIAEILEPGSDDWVTGKARIRLVIDFCPNAPSESKITESYSLNLDEIRQMTVE